MSLRLKMLLTASCGVVLSLALLGNFALSTYRTITIDNLASRLADTIREIDDIDDSPLQAAFYLSSVSNFPLQVGVADTNGNITSLSEIELPLKKLKIEQLEAALTRATEIESDELVIRTMTLGNAGYVVLASSVSELNKTLSDLRRNIILAALLLILSNAILVHLLTRRDFARVRRLVRQANEISGGDYKAEITSVTGVSEVAQLSQSIATMTKTLQENAENLQVLFGSISHELKTPLTAIRGYVELLESSSALTPEQEKSLDIISGEVERMTALINDLLLLSKLGTLQYELNDEFDIVEALQKRLQVLRDLQPDRPIQVLGEKSLVVQGSRGLLERLIENLISNILNHTSATASVSFTFSHTTTDWVLTYEDTGPGLPNTYGEGTEITFQKFDPRKSTGSTTGLGLFLIQSIIEQHRGKLEVVSRPGLKFTCIIPKKSINSSAQ